MKRNHLTLNERSAYRRLEDVVGCKWSAAVVGAVQRGVNRPGQLERFVPGISTKVLTERLRKLCDFGILTRHELPGRIRHVEYRLTPTGVRLARLLEQLHELQAEHEHILNDMYEAAPAGAAKPPAGGGDRGP